MTDDQVRIATAADIPGLVALTTGLFAEDSGTRDATLSQDWPRRHAAADFADAIRRHRRHLVVAADRATLTGYLNGAIGEPSAIRPIRVAVLYSMFVRPEARGRRVGGRLLEAFRGWAGAAGASHLSVTAYATNEAAIRFYRRHGFVAREVELELALP